MQEGLYESLLTEQLQARIKAAVGLTDTTAGVDDAELPLVVARHLGPLIQKALQRANSEQRLGIVNALLAVLAEAEIPADPPVTEGGKLQQLLAVRQERHAGQLVPPRILRRPATPLAEAALLTNARGEPTLAAELNAELDSVDEVDLLCAFVKWQGVRLLDRQLTSLRERDVPIRVLTTTYLGATDAKALDALVKNHGAEVRVNYETNRTRLHAKAWLLKRHTGFDTAYVGSSNLSQAALVDGVEWNVRLSATGSPTLIEKFKTTFESYWQSREFEPYDPDRDGDRLRGALVEAGGGSGREAIQLSGLEVRPLPHQVEILEQLDAERKLHDRHRNLVVAATGTGKTVVAALDYRRLVRETYSRDLTLLFVAHRAEILRQSQLVYQNVMGDASFGEELVNGKRPKSGRHVFASIQSLSAAKIEELDPRHFDVVVIDEFHHAQAASYQRLLSKIEPRELLGLTATPERTDGVDVRTFFDGRTAAELRLWDALDQSLLCPFHYFGINDGTNLQDITWKRGSYDPSVLSDRYVHNDARTLIVIKEVQAKVTDIGRMRALGFCVSKVHARYMAACFTTAGIPALAVLGDTPDSERRQAIKALREGSIRALFAVDIFNEGLDIPEIDTVLFLRPTESATVFLQQLGRGLRMVQGKSVLTVLDFVGHQRREFRFDQRFTALTGAKRKNLEDQVKNGFPFLPSGSQIILDEVTRGAVLANIRQQISPKWVALVSELKESGDLTLAQFIDVSGRDVLDILQRGEKSWTELRRDAGQEVSAGHERQEQLLRRMRRGLHIDDQLRVLAYGEILTREAERIALDSPRDRRLARMLFYLLFPDGGGFADETLGLAALAKEEAVRDELLQIIGLAFDQARRTTYRLAESAPGLDEIPLAVHASYHREEIMAALDMASLKRKPSNMREGVLWCDSVNADALLITIQKSEKKFSPSTMYKDYALSPNIFHWESQFQTSVRSATGQRYINHQERGSHILLFVRTASQGVAGTSPYIFLGPADYISHEGERPMAITWKLRQEMPMEVYLAARVAIS